MVRAVDVMAICDTTKGLIDKSKFKGLNSRLHGLQKHPTFVVLTFTVAKDQIRELQLYHHQIVRGSTNAW